MAGLGGLEVLPRVARDFPAVKVLILSAHANEEYVLRALRSGAAGYMLKDAAAEELELAIKAVAQDKTYLSPSISRTVVEKLPPPFHGRTRSDRRPHGAPARSLATHCRRQEHKRSRRHA
jgi:DNA-binding NarL/FixJ family response regulator